MEASRKDDELDHLVADNRSGYLRAHDCQENTVIPVVPLYERYGRLTTSANKIASMEHQRIFPFARLKDTELQER